MYPCILDSDLNQETTKKFRCHQATSAAAIRQGAKGFVDDINFKEREREPDSSLFSLSLSLVVI